MASSKIEPPNFINSAAEYAPYKKKLERWARISKEPKNKQAEIVLYHLEGHPLGMQSKIDCSRR